MSTTEDKASTVLVTDRILHLLPEDIGEPEETNVRPFSAKVGDTEAEIAAIEALMRSIVSEGQLQPVRVKATHGTKDGEEKYKLIVGRRRRRAVMMHNLALSNGEEPLRVECVLVDEDLKTPKMFRQAAHENILREGLSPMDFAMDIQTVRAKFKWEGHKGAKKVADFFEVSPATITQHEKLLTLPEDLQLKVHKGEVSRDDAFTLAAVAEKGGPNAAADALKAGEQAEQEVLAGAAEVDTDETVEATGTETETGTKKAAKKKAVKAVKKAAKTARKKAIATAAREAGVAQPRSKKEIVEFFEGLLGPIYGYPDGAVHQFVTNFLKWVNSEIQDRTLEKYFDAMVAKAPKGTKESADKIAEQEKASKKKATAAKKK